jgi:hypothetical protein
MLILAAISVTCWLCALVASPRKPLPGNEVEELVYARLLGRQHRLALLALVVTIVAFVAVVIALPQRIPRSESAVAEMRQASDVCPVWSGCDEWEHAGYVPLNALTVAAAAGMNRGAVGYDAILEAMEQVGNASTMPVAASIPQSGQAEYDQILTALEMANGVVTINALPGGGGPG